MNKLLIRSGIRGLIWIHFVRTYATQRAFLTFAYFDV